MCIRDRRRVHGEHRMKESKEIREKKELREREIKKNKEIQDIDTSSYLPFGSMINRIVEDLAHQLDDAPKKPAMEIKLQFKEFKAYFERYHEIFKMVYYKLASEARMNGTSTLDIDRLLEGIHFGLQPSQKKSNRG
eukprot:TRINITY_DN5797_c0_g1_i1.p2 TRINITY_DN5797_c0_g1~~TRINITY_DN5797_c0_g1_i1.p2  ORF type:complete len:136 (-),score=45.39 TRINITY_DN5797_c0_g1_i1:988-1395(-)